MNFSKKKANYDIVRSFLKKKLGDGDLKSHNRIKMLVYYYPELIENVSEEALEFVLKNCETVYILLNQNDRRYKVLDDFYEKKHGKPFEPKTMLEDKYLTVNEFCEFYHV